MEKKEKEKITTSRCNNIQLLELINIQNEQLQKITKNIKKAENIKRDTERKREYIYSFKEIYKHIDMYLEITDDWERASKVQQVGNAKRFIQGVIEKDNIDIGELHIHIYNLLGLCIRCLNGLTAAYNYMAVYNSKINSGDIVEMERMIRKEKRVVSR